MKTRCLHLILGDQLNRASLIFDHFDFKKDNLLMAEVTGESTTTLSSKQRTVAFLSAMRHFAEQLQQDNLPLHYYPLGEGLKSFSAALSAHHKTQPFEAIRCVLPGDQRVVQEIKNWADCQQVSLQWLPDQHFISRRGEFKKWLKGRKQPRMEYWYRQLRRDRNILMNDDQPVGEQWNFDKDNRKTFGKSGPCAPAGHVFTRQDYP